MTTRFLYDRLYIMQSEGQKLQAVFLAHNNFVGDDVSSYDHMEVVLSKYKQSFDYRESLSDFYSRGELPFRWGSIMWCSRVTGEEYLSFMALMMDLLKLDSSELKGDEHPNIREALSWPTGSPTLGFIKLNCRSSDWSINFQKSRTATLLLRAGGSDEGLEEAIVKTHKKIIMESSIRGFDPKFFPGLDLIREVACLQCVRLMNASCFDTVHTAYPSRLLDLLAMHRSTYTMISSKLLGNRKWTPVQGTHFDEPDATYSFSSDSE
ncbi:nonstructural protein [Gabek Forest virus]|uniref:Nonstructural protein n=1 Tax=Gabek Forest virus TaxID=629736 RepID=W8JX57_9VIRU|nr:nonstructural protein [Gabek Forest virus]AHK60936.1 nonstructural protein [Gabek Forest virus]